MQMWSDANKFISGLLASSFGKRSTFSSKPEISLEEELDYLTNYLELEKTRLGKYVQLVGE